MEKYRADEFFDAAAREYPETTEGQESQNDGVQETAENANNDE